MKKSKARATAPQTIVIRPEPILWERLEEHRAALVAEVGRMPSLAATCRALLVRGLNCSGQHMPTGPRIAKAKR